MLLDSFDCTVQFSLDIKTISFSLLWFRFIGLFNANELLAEEAVMIWI